MKGDNCGAIGHVGYMLANTWNKQAGAWPHDWSDLKAETIAVDTVLHVAQGYADLKESRAVEFQSDMEQDFKKVQAVQQDCSNKRKSVA